MPNEARQKEQGRYKLDIMNEHIQHYKRLFGRSTGRMNGCHEFGIQVNNINGYRKKEDAHLKGLN